MLLIEASADRPVALLVSAAPGRKDPIQKEINLVEKQIRDLDNEIQRLINKPKRDERDMTDRHDFIEGNDNGSFAVRAKGSKRAPTLFNTEKQAILAAKQFNSQDPPDAERVRNMKRFARDQWRSR